MGVVSVMGKRRIVLGSNTCNTDGDLNVANADCHRNWKVDNQPFLVVLLAQREA